MWLAVDTDESESIQQVEFSRFVKLAGVQKSDTKQFSFSNKLLDVRKGAMSIEDQKRVSDLLNLKINAFTVESGTDAEKWFGLFKAIDDDASGLITYEELETGVRGKLQVTEEELSLKELKGLWIALDEDDSGYIEQAEFHRFMDREEPKTAVAKRQESMRQSSKQIRQQMEKEAATYKKDQGLVSSKTTNQMIEELTKKNKMPDDLMKAELAVKFAMWVKEYLPDAHQAIAWLKVFKEVDNDETGIITYDEVRRVIRQKFKKGPSKVSEDTMMQIWVCADEDGSDTIMQAEFGRFVKLAGEIKSGDGRRAFGFSDHRRLDPRKGGLSPEDAKA